jgi:hypothetical protein
MFMFGFFLCFFFFFFFLKLVANVCVLENLVREGD